MIYIKSSTQCLFLFFPFGRLISIPFVSRLSFPRKIHLIPLTLFGAQLGWEMKRQRTPSRWLKRISGMVQVEADIYCTVIISFVMFESACFSLWRWRRTQSFCIGHVYVECRLVIRDANGLAGLLEKMDEWNRIMEVFQRERNLGLWFVLGQAVKHFLLIIWYGLEPCILDISPLCT